MSVDWLIFTRVLCFAIAIIGMGGGVYSLVVAFDYKANGLMTRGTVLMVVGLVALALTASLRA